METQSEVAGVLESARLLVLEDDFIISLELQSVLGAAGAGMPNLWLELRPTRAFAGQPHIDSTAVTLTIGVEAQTRIVPNETKPDCPFPAQLELVPQIEQGRTAALAACRRQVGAAQDIIEEAVHLAVE